MPDVRSLIETARSKGVTLLLVEDRVRVQLPPASHEDARELIEELRKYRAEVKSILEEDDPILAGDQWYPHFRDFHHKVIFETPDFDYGELRKQNPDLFRQIKAKENEIDALGSARLSQVMAVMREWRTLTVHAYFEQRQSDKK
jgi:hypothetical protein